MDEIADNASSAAEKSTHGIQWITNIFAAAVGQPVTALIEGLTGRTQRGDERLTISQLHKRLAAAEKSLGEKDIAISALQERIKELQKDGSKKYKEEYENNLALGLPDKEAEQKAVEAADRYLIEQHGDDLGLAMFTVGNERIEDLERDMTKNGIDFIMVQDQAVTRNGESAFMIRAEDKDRVSEFDKDLSKRVLLVDQREMDHIFNTKYVEKVSGFSHYDTYLYVQREMNRIGVNVGVMSRDAKPVLVLEKADIIRNKDYYENVIKKACMIDVSEVQKRIGSLEKAELEADKAVDHITGPGYRSEEAAFTVYDSAHPENSITAKNGAAFIYEDCELKGDPLDLKEPTSVSKIKEEAYELYLSPVKTDKDDIQDVEFRELYSHHEDKENAFRERSVLEKALDDRTERTRIDQERKLSRDTYDHGDQEINKYNTEYTDEMQYRDDTQKDRIDEENDSKENILASSIHEDIDCLETKGQALKDSLQVDEGMYHVQEIEHETEELPDKDHNRSKGRNSVGDLDKDGIEETDDIEHRDRADKDRESEEISIAPDDEEEMLSADDFGEEVPDDIDFDD